jgi:hypothetical protein
MKVPATNRVLDRESLPVALEQPKNINIKSRVAVKKNVKQTTTSSSPIPVPIKQKALRGSDLVLSLHSNNDIAAGAGSEHSKFIIDRGTRGIILDFLSNTVKSYR